MVQCCHCLIITDPMNEWSLKRLLKQSHKGTLYICISGEECPTGMKGDRSMAHSYEIYLQTIECARIQRDLLEIPCNQLKHCFKYQHIQTTKASVPETLPVSEMQATVQVIVFLQLLWEL